MPTIEYLNKRIKAAKAKIAKYEDSLETYREMSKEDEYYKWYVPRLEKSIEKTKNELASFELSLKQEEEKKNSRNVQAILDFLDKWKEKVFNFYKSKYESLKTYEDLVKTEIPEVVGKYYPHSLDKNYYDPNETEEETHKRYAGKDVASKLRNLAYRKDYEDQVVSHWDKRPLKETEIYQENPELIEKLAIIRNLKDVLSNIRGVYSYKGFDEERLHKILDQEAEAKYDDIIARTNAKVGQITDASNLSIGDKGELNGRIDGTNGSVWVETIGAGGYNIQCYHFRTLIKPIREKKMTEAYENRDSLRSDLLKRLSKYCGYRGMGRDGVPYGMGDELKFFGEDVDYSCRPKYYDVTVRGDDITIEWECQEYLETPAGDTFEAAKDMLLTTLDEHCKYLVEGRNVKIVITDRDGEGEPLVIVNGEEVG